MTSRIDWNSCAHGLLQIGMSYQPSKGRAACLPAGSLGQHRIDAHHIDRHGREHMLQMDLLQASIARPAQPHAADPLGERPFNASSGGILLAKLLGLLFLPACLQGFMRGLRTQMQHSSRGQGVRTLSARRTPLADLRRKHHFEALPRQAPALTELSVWTDYL